MQQLDLAVQYYSACMCIFTASECIINFLTGPLPAYSRISIEPLQWLSPFECMKPSSILYEIKLQIIKEFQSVCI